MFVLTQTQQVCPTLVHTHTHILKDMEVEGELTGKKGISKNRRGIIQDSSGAYDHNTL